MKPFRRPALALALLIGALSYLPGCEQPSSSAPASPEPETPDVSDSIAPDDVSALPEPKLIQIDLSDAEELHAPGEAAAPLKLTILSETDNGIDGAEAWYARENLSLPMIGTFWDHFYDEHYEYLWDGSGLYLYDRETGAPLYVLEYPTDRWYINGNNALLKDGVFYGVRLLNGYAQPDSCYLFAYDLEQEKLLWRSADQTCNSMNFLVVGDVILCGYGFTDEPDYLYQIDLHTGAVLDSLPLKKMPDLLAERDGKLYVHTYSYDYIIAMEPQAEAANG